MKKISSSFYNRVVKRAIDFSLSLFLLICLSPVLGIVALLVRVKLGSPVIFSQERPGKDEKLFKICKFRTMTNERDPSGNLLPDNIRLTSFGKFLRRSSLDELPELLNIIKGEMSLIGPRPLSKLYLPYYTQEERKRHKVRPGLTGLAQISGRNYLSWEDRFALDLFYVENVSFSFDVKILLKTIYKVVKRSDVGVIGENIADNSLDDIRKAAGTSV